MLLLVVCTLDSQLTFVVFFFSVVFVRKKAREQYRCTCAKKKKRKTRETRRKNGVCVFKRKKRKTWSFSFSFLSFFLVLISRVGFCMWYGFALLWKMRKGIVNNDSSSCKHRSKKTRDRK